MHGANRMRPTLTRASVSWCTTQPAARQSGQPMAGKERQGSLETEALAWAPLQFWALALAAILPYASLWYSFVKCLAGALNLLLRC